MASVGDTTARPSNAAAGPSTSTDGLHPISVDRHDIRSLRVAASPIPSTLPTDGFTGEQNGTSTHTETQMALKSSDACAFSILTPRVREIPTPTLYPTQEWEGQVIEVHDDEFEARLLDLTASDEGGREVATIPLEEVGAEDRSLMREGAIFRWVIGYERSVGGARRRVSQIVFLDPPQLTERDIATGREWAEWLLEEWRVE